MPFPQFPFCISVMYFTFNNSTCYYVPSSLPTYLPFCESTMFKKESEEKKILSFKFLDPNSKRSEASCEIFTYLGQLDQDNNY